jgi:hypothetical protein
METVKLIIGHGRLITDGYLTFSGFPGEVTFVPAVPRPRCRCQQGLPIREE